MVLLVRQETHGVGIGRSCKQIHTVQEYVRACGSSAYWNWNGGSGVLNRVRVNACE